MSVLVSVAWYAPGDLVGRMIADVTRSPVCHVGCALGDTYLDVQPPRVRLLDGGVPGGAFIQRAYPVGEQEALAGLAYLHELEGTSYPELTLALDLVNAVAGTHLEASADGRCVCSGAVANVLVRVGLLQSVSPEQETPASLLARLPDPNAAPSA